MNEVSFSGTAVSLDPTMVLIILCLVLIYLCLRLLSISRSKKRALVAEKRYSQALETRLIENQKLLKKRSRI